MALKIWENQYEIIKKIPQKKSQEKLSLAILDYAFTGKHDKLEFPLNAIIQGMYVGLTLKNQGGAPVGNKNNRYTTVVQPLYNSCTNVVHNVDTTEEQPLFKNRNKKEEKDISNDISKKINKKNYTSEFEEWWKLCPKKVDKDKAFKIFQTILEKKKATIEELTEGMKQYFQKCVRENTEEHYIKHPSTWLNCGSWKDDFTQWKTIETDKPDAFEGFSQAISEFKRRTNQ